MKREMPWDHPRAPEPGEPVYLNLPTLAGAEMGSHMARFYEAERAARGLEDQRCVDCAFRLGSLPNGAPLTQMSALKCLMEGETFYCHHGEDRPCQGAAVLASTTDDRAPASG